MNEENNKMNQDIDIHDYEKQQYFTKRLKQGKADINAGLVVDGKKAFERLMRGVIDAMKIK